MAETTLVSLQIDDVNNLYYKHTTENAENGIIIPDGSLVPGDGSWTQINAASDLEFMNDGDMQLLKLNPIPSNYARLYGMFEIKLPSQGFDKLLQINISSRILHFVGMGAGWKWYVFNFTTNQWEDFVELIISTPPIWIKTDNILNLSNIENITDYFNSGKFYVMLYTEQSTTDDDDPIQLELDYFRVDLLYCVPYYCSVADVRYVSNLKPEELPNEDICKTILKAQQDRIDPTLKNVYTVPFTEGSVPSKIRWLCADIAAAMALMKVYIGTTPNETSYVRALLDKGDKQLNALANGDEELVEESGVEGGALSSSGTQPAVFDLCDYPDISTDDHTDCCDNDQVDGA